MAVAGPAMAQTYVGVPPPQVSAVDAGGATRSQIVAPTPAATRAGGLAFTGADVMELVAIAGSSVAVGAVIVRLSRSRVTP
jgi:hypothetical protein